MCVILGADVEFLLTIHYFCSAMNENYLSQLYFKETSFRSLMQQRIYGVLLVASAYDAFAMEEDGRLEEQIYMEYMSLNLSSPPRVTLVSDYGHARQVMEAQQFDLVICMPGPDVGETTRQMRSLKAMNPDVPMVLLTPFSREVSRHMRNEDLSGIDYVFSWLGNVDLLVAIIKLIEDKMNAAHDITEIGMQVIVLVEDSVRFYSSILPTLYRFILQQSQRFSTEALNGHEAMLRMRGRPKVMLARNYEEAQSLYRQYGHNMLGVISDVSFSRAGAKDKQAGLRLARWIREQDPHLPIIVESSEAENRDRVGEFGGVFLDKNSKKLPVDLGQAVMENFGFGDFVIVDPATGSEIERIHDLKELQDKIFEIPDDALYYHCSRDDVSRWLYSRALFSIAEVAKMHHFADMSEAPRVRQLIFDLIVRYRRMKNRGVVAEFKRERYDKYSSFARIGKGSLGGKGRGLAFVDTIIKRHPQCDNWQGVSIRIPHTVVLCTDIFDEFMETNGLYPMALSDVPDAEILRAFLDASLPQRLNADLLAIARVVRGPMAVRSSSLLEDSHYQPFAGIYSTYMIPYDADDDTMLRLLTDAIKAVYASVFYHDSKAYMVATSNVIDQEKMAVIIQEVVGDYRGGDDATGARYFYPSVSGVGRSLNYYPVGDEQPSHGVAEVAVGLGKYIVDGGKALRLSPRHPRHIVQTSTLQNALRETQTKLYALDVSRMGRPTMDENFDIATLQVNDEARKGNLQYLVSTYDANDQRLTDTDQGPGRKVVTMAGVLQHDVFPLASALQFMLETGQHEMGRPVEIEFAALVGDSKQVGAGEPGSIYWLQIRPMVDRREMLDEHILEAPVSQQLMATDMALGHGTMEGITSLVFVKPEAFGLANNAAIAQEIEAINKQYADRGEGYVLVGLGRWGSSDHALGVPVKWTHISAARLLVELNTPECRIEPSQGTHFFQNLTSYGVGYFTIGLPGRQSHIDLDYLASLPASYESEHVRIVTFPQALTVSINGVKGLGVVLKPGVQSAPGDTAE